MIYGVSIVALPAGDQLVMSPLQRASSGYGYNLTLYELKHLPAKWLHIIYSRLPWTAIDDDARGVALERYIDLVPKLREAKTKLEEATAQGDARSIAAAQRDLDALLGERNEIRDLVEEHLEAAISAQLVRLWLSQGDDFVWPPVDFRLHQPPNIAVTSPRHVIRREEVKLIRPEISEADRVWIETEIEADGDLSAAVLRTGGLAAYPNIVPSDLDLLALLEVTAHEWLHAYLLFHPLGRSYWQGGDITSLNETLADMAGDEIGRLAYNAVTGEDVEVSLPPPSVIAESEDADDESEKFDFREFMYETRKRTDELLVEGRIDEAEAYMEERRLVLVENRYNIRKLNQAYFAFHGLYAAGSTSTSPLASQLWQFRQESADVGVLVKKLQSISSFGEYLVILDEHGIER